MGTKMIRKARVTRKSTQEEDKKRDSREPEERKENKNLKLREKAKMIQKE